jgi:hypothetical protein
MKDLVRHLVILNEASTWTETSLVTSTKTERRTPDETKSDRTIPLHQIRTAGRRMQKR